MNKAQPTAADISALVSLVDQGRLEEAEQAARSLLAKQPEAAILWKILGVALLRQGKDALRVLRKTSDMLPGDAEAHANLGAALHDRGQWADALKSLNRALEIQPRAPQTLLDTANCLKALDRATESVPLYQRALQLYPTLLEARNNLGNAFLSLGQAGEAAACFRYALRITPTDALILCNLGNALRQCGLLEEATVISKQALTQNPKLSVAHNNLGLIYAAQGRRDEALAAYQAALAHDPRYADALNNLGHLLREAGRRTEALSLYAQAVDKDPARADSHCNVGNMLFELRKPDEAASAYARSLQLKLSYGPAHLGLANVLRLWHRDVEAERSCQVALSIDPNDVEALCLLGELAADRGRFTEAEELFRRASLLKPDFAAAWCGVANHRKMTADDHGWKDGAEALLAKPLSLGHAIDLRFALGKYFDDTHQYDEAFGQYELANELSKRYGETYDSAKFTQRIDQIIGSFDASFLRAHEGQGANSEAPIFIVGMPRSGTSLTEQILASHPAVFGAGEVNFWDSAFVAYQKAVAAGGDVAPLLLGVATDYLARLPSSAGAALRVTDKLPANFMYLGLIHAVFPNARIIHAQRHPLDTCLSIYFQNLLYVGRYANDLGSIAHHYGEYRRVTDHWRAILPPNSFLEIPYEGVIANQEAWTRRMLDFVGLPWDPACMEFHKTERVVLTTSRWQVRQKIHSSSVERWKHYAKFVGPLMHLAPVDNRREH